MLFHFRVRGCPGYLILVSYSQASQIKSLLRVEEITIILFTELHRQRAEVILPPPYVRELTTRTVTDFRWLKRIIKVPKELQLNLNIVFTITAIVLSEWYR